MQEKQEVKINKEGKKVLASGFHIRWATDYTINNNAQAILDLPTSL